MPYSNFTNLMIRSLVSSDDGVMSAAFDASPFFEDAAARSLIRLGGQNWRGELAQRVAESFEHAEQYRAVGDVFRYAHQTDAGVLCEIFALDALTWLRACRRPVFNRLARCGPLPSHDIANPSLPPWDRELLKRMAWDAAFTMKDANDAYTKALDEFSTLRHTPYQRTLGADRTPALQVLADAAASATERWHLINHNGEACIDWSQRYASGLGEKHSVFVKPAHAALPAASPRMGW